MLRKRGWEMCWINPGEWVEHANDQTAEPLARAGSTETGGGAFVFREPGGETFSFEAAGATTNGDPDSNQAQFPDGFGPLCKHAITCLSGSNKTLSLQQLVSSQYTGNLPSSNTRRF
eukprot:COSAG02_NODE_17520_length_998_cov_0.780868_2_plen_117_part_00